jgi:peptidoglycan/LPS O-acetylase OafA/YrhL
VLILVLLPTLVIADVTHRVVERPTRAMGRRLARRFEQSPAPTMTPAVTVA